MRVDHLLVPLTDDEITLLLKAIWSHEGELDEILTRNVCYDNPIYQETLDEFSYLGAIQGKLKAVLSSRTR